MFKLSKMKQFRFNSNLALLSLTMFALIMISSCNNDDPDPDPLPTGDEMVFTIGSVNVGLKGTATFAKLDNNSVLITLKLDGTSSGGDHPTHIHLNTAAEGGAIALDLTNVDGATGMSETTVSALNDGTVITYEELIDFDGYINVHVSTSELGTLIAQGDIGQNAFTGMSEDYDLAAVSNPNISGKATIAERKNGESLLMINLEGDDATSDHPAHIHMNTAAEGGGIIIDLNNVVAGLSNTNIASKNNGTAISYDDLKDIDGYINVHNSGDDLGTLVAQGDIGQNKLTGKSETYDLGAMGGSGISGMVKFAERMNTETLVMISLEGDAADSDHPTHIHMNTAAEGGGIVIDLTNVMAGKSKTNIAMKNDDTKITYAEMLLFDGYINIHNSGDDLGTLVAQGDIGQNAFTGESMTYTLDVKSDPNISGTAKFIARNSGETLIIVTLSGTVDGGSHPAHIHMNNATMGGGIVLNLTNIDGVTGMSKTNVSMLNNETPVNYGMMINYDGYINVHNSSDDLGTLIAQGNIGSNG